MRELPELRAALRNAVVDDDVATVRTVADELTLYREPQARALELHARGVLQVYAGQMETAIEHFRLCVDLRREIGEPEQIILALLDLANAQMKAGYATVAVTFLEEGLDLAQRAEFAELAAHCEGALGVAKSMMGDLDGALKHVTAELAYSSEKGDQRGVLSALGNIGTIYWKLGKIPKAIEYLRRCQHVAHEMKDRFSVALTHQNLGAVYSSIGDHAESLVEYNKAAACYREIDHADGLAAIRVNIGRAMIQLGDFETAEQELRHSLLESRRSKKAWSEANDLDTLAACYAEQRQFDSAIDHVQRAIEIYQELGMIPEVGRSTARLARIYLECGRVREAWGMFDRIDALPVTTPHDELFRAEIRALLEIDAGDLARAERVLEEAIMNAGDAGSVDTELQLRGHLRTIAHRRGDLEAYVLRTNEYLALADKLKGQDALQRIAILESERRAREDLDERQRERHVLHRTLPPDIADRAVRGEDVSGDLHEQAAVLFLDTVSFTKHSSELAPKQLTAFLGTIFRELDRICEQHSVITVKTIGDAYLAVALEGEGERSAINRMAQTALEINALSLRWPSGDRVEFRIGLHTGPLVTGVIGTNRLQYDVWGDTVNVASRMESTGEPGRIQVSSAFASALDIGERISDIGHHSSDSRYPISDIRSPKLTKRGSVEVKGKGTMTTYWLEGA